MYRYDAIDQQLVDDRVRQFRDQTARFLANRYVGPMVGGRSRRR